MSSTVKRDAAATRSRILAAAKLRFGSIGFDRTTVRAIADDAHVSPNLITRYFGGKDGLFRAATEMDLRVSEAMRGPRSSLGHRIATHIATRWEAAVGADPLVTMLRVAMTDAKEANRMAEFFQQQAIEPLARYLGGDDGWERASALSAFIMGAVTQRYVLGVGPIASATPQSLVAWLGAALQCLIDATPMPSLATNPDRG